MASITNTQQQIISASDIREMVTHHLSCPPNGYLGSEYGSNIKAMLAKPMTGAADSFIKKLKSDVPITQMAGDKINVYSRDIAIDAKEIIIEVGGQIIVAGGV
jgi:hypothetical protein